MYLTLSTRVNVLARDSIAYFIIIFGLCTLVLANCLYKHLIIVLVLQSINLYSDIKVTFPLALSGWVNIWSGTSKHVLIVFRSFFSPAMCTTSIAVRCLSYDGFSLIWFHHSRLDAWWWISVDWSWTTHNILFIYNPFNSSGHLNLIWLQRWNPVAFQVMALRTCRVSIQQQYHDRTHPPCSYYTGPELLDLVFSFLDCRSNATDAYVCSLVRYHIISTVKGRPWFIAVDGSGGAAVEEIR